jgi:hypothetical protein
MTEELKLHLELKHRVKITRKVSANSTEQSNGYILAFSEHFVLLQETDDFIIDGYAVFPLSTITRITFNRNDKYFDKIMRLEGKIKEVGIGYIVNLNSWPSVFKSLQQKKFNVIVKCEDPAIDSFDIGPIIKTGNKYVYIQYFDATGLLDNEPTTIDFDSITYLTFDNHYINIFSKYLRHRKKR